MTKQRLTGGESSLLVWELEDRRRAEIRVVGEGIVMPCGGLSVQRLLWHLPGIPQGSSHCSASLIPPSHVKPHISSLFLCVTQAFLQPPFLLLLQPSLCIEQRKQRGGLKSFKTCALRRNPSPFCTSSPFIPIAQRLKMYSTLYST